MAGCSRKKINSVYYTQYINIACPNAFFSVVFENFQIAFSAKIRFPKIDDELKSIKNYNDLFWPPIRSLMALICNEI